MGKRKLSIADLKSQISTLQDKLEHEEQKVNCEIGAWVRQKTKVETLTDFQAKFLIVPKKTKLNSDKIGDKISENQDLENDVKKEETETRELRELSF
ncbi:MAG: hypothetical protein IK062_03380 [Selenomonadaceae bacterium]|nr:hypothetical protein [Selenomonadaceae bacterium]